MRSSGGSRRLWKRALGLGSITRAASAVGLSRPVIPKGLDELKECKPGFQIGSCAKAGGGRKTLRIKDTTLMEAFDRLVDSGTRGDPMSPLR